MSVRVIVPPEPLVDLAAAKAFLRVDHDDDNDLIEGLVLAGQSEVDGPNGWLGRAIGEQTLEATFSGFCPWMPLPYPSLQEIVAVTYAGSGGVFQTVDPAIYEVFEQGVRSKAGSSWPSAYGCDAVRVQYVAGTVLDTLALERVKVAIKLHVRGYYDREGDGWRGAFDALLSSLRKFT